MDFSYDRKVQELQGELTQFMETYIYPNEKLYEEQLHQTSRFAMVPPIIEELKERAKAQGLWNLFTPDQIYGAGLSNLQYAPLCEIMGRSLIAPEVFNCNAPDTGNMEVLIKYGTAEQKEKWLKPLLNGEIRSCFGMTEPAVASSDATNIESTIIRDGDEYVLNGTKWWTSGAGDPRCQLMIFMGRNTKQVSKYEQQSMILVPMDTKGVTIKRMLPVFGYDSAPHGHAEVELINVRVPASHMLWGEGKGFAIAQGRLGPGRIHHCMRLIGSAQRALELMIKRTASRETFGQPIAEHGVIQQWLADAKMEIEQARLLTLKAAYMMDTVGNKAAKTEIAMIKVVAPRMAQKVIDRAIQAFGGAGVSDDFILAHHYANARTLRIADGPDEVHSRQIARLLIKQLQNKEVF